VSQLHLGEPFFTNRERISQIHSGILALAGKTNTELGSDFTRPALEADLNRPFIFTFSGEINAGKSSLINAISGSDLCEVSVLPETKHVTCYTYAEVSEDIETAPLIRESHRPEEILRNFHFIDSPGCNAELPGYDSAIATGFSEAELILFVFPINNPWSASTWNLISQLPEDLHHKMVFVLQQVDQKQPEDIEIILEHMAYLAPKRIAKVPPMFAVAAKLVLEAKKADSIDSRLLEKSGMRALENFISAKICDSTERNQTIRKWHELSHQALRLIEDRMEHQSRSHVDQHEFLSSLEYEIDAMREALVSRLPRHLTEVAEVFESEAIWVTKKLKTWLNLPLSLLRIFVGDRTGLRTESLFIGRLRSAVELVAESDGKDVVVACRNHWLELDARVRESIGAGFEDSGPIDEKLEQARSRFVQRIGSAAHQAIGDLHVRKELERELRKRNRALKSFTASGLFFLSLGAGSGFMGHHILPWILCAVALVFFIGGAIIGTLTKSGMTKDFQSSLLDTCGTFADTLKSDYEEALRIFFQDYTSCLNSIRRYLAGEKIAIEPKLKEWQGLFLSLKSAEQDL
jgi:GTPase Era involved in 16S rRNA processing